MCRNVTVELDLTDADTSYDGQQQVRIVAEPRGISISARGYGDHGSVDDYGCPVFIEHYQGNLRLVIFGDINQQEPTIIDLSAARESNRTS